VKRTRMPPTGNPLAPFEVPAAGDGLTASPHGQKLNTAGTDGRHRGQRASPRPYLRFIGAPRRDR
jgi:hypothetical protein